MSSDWGLWLRRCSVLGSLPPLCDEDGFVPTKHEQEIKARTARTLSDAVVIDALPASSVSDPANKP